MYRWLPVLRQFRIFACALLAFGTTPALSFDVLPEYHALTETERDSIAGASLIDAEYQSDVVTFLEPLAWDPAFFASHASFNLSFGSLSYRYFFERNRLRLETALGENLRFRLSSFSQRDHDHDQTQVAIELITKLNANLALAVYGKPSYFKRENDLGAAVIFTARAGHELRLFHTWVDFTREKHNNLDDYFIRDRSPTSVGLVGRCFGCFQAPLGSSPRPNDDWLEYFVRWETPVDWRLPTEQRRFEYELATAGLNARLALGEATETAPPAVLNMRAQATKKYEGQSPLGAGSTVTTEALEARVLEFLSSIDLPTSDLGGQRVSLEPGLGWFHRRWVNESAETMEHRNLMPFVWLHFTGPRRGPETYDRVDLGFEATIFEATGGATLAQPDLKRATTESRANLRYEYALEGDARLGLTVTGDIDAALRGGEGGLFEGGHGWLRAFF